VQRTTRTRLDSIGALLVVESGKGGVGNAQATSPSLWTEGGRCGSRKAGRRSGTPCL